MAQRIREHDWAMTPLGPAARWSPRMRTCVEVVLGSAFPSFLIWGPDHTILYNDAYAGILFGKHPAALGRPFREVWPEIWDTLDPLVRRTIVGGETHTMDDLPFVMRRKGFDEETWFSYSYAPLRDEDGRIAGLICTCMETTARVRAEASLRESEARQAFLLRLTDALRPLADPGAVQEEAVRLLGDRFGASRTYYYEFDEATGTGSIAREHAPAGPRPIAGTYAATDWPSVHAALRTGETLALADATTDARFTAVEREGFAALGFRAWVCVPLVKAGRLVAALSVVRPGPGAWAAWEVSLIEEVAERTWAAVERARAEAALRAGEARLRALVTAGANLVYRMSPDWRHLHQLDGHGVLADTIATDENWAEVYILPEDRAHVLAAIEAAKRDRTVFELEHRVRRADGGVGWVLSRAVPILGPDGELVEWFGAASDVTERREAVEALRLREATYRADLERQVAERTAELMSAEESLRQAQKMEAVGQLTGGIAHDFNNMLQGVVGGLVMARRRIARGEADGAARYLDAAHEAAERAARLTRRLLAFARRQRLEPRPVDADGLVAGLEDLIRRTVGPAISLELDLRGAGVVRCDQSELESALVNLCINARDAMPEGGGLAIRSAVRELRAAEAQAADVTPGSYVEIAVEDTGMGMPADVTARAFEPFFTTKPLGQGTGLGLSQVWGFARQSNGLVRIESLPGRGTTVRLLLPRHAGEAAAVTAPAPAPPAGTARGTVLLVDDEDAVRTPAADRLRELGVRVIEARDGPEALRLLAASPRPDLLVTDVGLPAGMNGRQVAEAAREHLPDLPVLFITGYAGSALPPMVEIIGKPFDLEALAHRVQAILDAHRQNPERDCSA